MAEVHERSDVALADLAVGRYEQRLTLLGRHLGGFASPVRLSILLLLIRLGETTAGDLVEKLQLPQQRIWEHLRILTWCGYVKDRRKGRHAYYSVADERVGSMIELGMGLLEDNARGRRPALEGRAEPAPSAGHFAHD